jgi:hypothetical protein
MNVQFQPPYDRAAYLGTKKSKRPPAMLAPEATCHTSGNIPSTNDTSLDVNGDEGLPAIAQKAVDLASYIVHQKPFQEIKDAKGRIPSSTTSSGQVV